MSSRPDEGMSEGSIPTSISSSKGKISPRAPISSSDPLKVAPPSTPANVCPPGLACPVSGCPFVPNRQKPHQYLKRHLNHPGLYGRKDQEKENWLNLHKIEHERLLASLEGNQAEEARNSRAGQFKMGARSMGITEERFVAQKVAIWEGMRAAEQNRDHIEYYAWALLDAGTSSDQ